MRELLSAYAGVDAAQIVVTNGGDESIDLVLRAVLEPQDVVLDAPPSFEMYRISTLANRGRVVDVPRRDDFSLDVEAVCRAAKERQPKALALASPNNPDGDLLPRADLLKLLALPMIGMLDEAYFEFAGESAVDLLATHPNLVIVRTFSKWAALASLRVGYILASPEFANALHKLRAPYNVTWAGVVAARESLLDAEYLLKNVRTICAERERMRIAYSNLGWLEPLPSYTNFLTMRVRGRDPQQIKQALAQQGILIRAFKAPRLAEYLRISVGTSEQNDAVLKALEGL